MRKNIIAIIILACIGIASVVTIYWISITLYETPEEANEAPIILTYYPLLNPSIDETESQEFNVGAYDPDGDPLTYGWYLDGIKVGGNLTTYIFDASGKPIGSYTVKVNVTDGDLTVDHSWTLTVLLENHAPIILTYYPLINPSIYETESQEFNVTASDPEGDPLTYGWYLDGIKVGGNLTTYTFDASGKPIGPYTVKVNVTDGDFVVDHSWTLTVLLEEELRIATTSNPITMDPVDSWDTNSNYMLDQVVETLIAYNLSDPTFPLVGRLAETWDFQSTKFGTNITFQLRDNVYFHDGAKLDGNCVLHTFERINFFGNATGTLTPPNHVAFPHSLYKFPDGTPIFNHTLSFVNPVDDLEVTLVLNGPFGPAEGLLTYTASAIVHPDSTPVDSMLELGIDLVIGTGPFKLVNYVPNSEVRFERWEGYWRTPAFWNKIIYVKYIDSVAANDAMLAGEIDYLGQGIDSYKPTFEADPDITVTGDGDNDFINGSIYWYIAFNSVYINKTWRKAISYAFNYTYLIHDIREDTVVRAHSLVPPSFPGYNASVVGGTFNIPKARQIMQSMGFGVGWEIGSQVEDEFTPGAHESLWQAAAWVPDTGNFTDNIWNFRHLEGSSFYDDLIQRFGEDMDLIGIDVAPQPLVWWEFLEMFENHPDRLHIYYVGWGPDYFEAFNMIDPLVNPASASNFAQINDDTINALLDLAIAETDTATRYQYYKRLQSIIIDREFYHMPLTIPILSTI